MTVVDERARAPRLDEAALRRLSDALDREGVITAMLIGSHARATAGPLSDMDIGVWHSPGLDSRARLQLRLELARAASEALRTAERHRIEEGRFGRRRER